MVDRDREARIIEEKTRDQTVRYAPPTEATKSTFAANDEVGGILARFRRPPGLGAA